MLVIDMKKITSIYVYFLLLIIPVIAILYWVGAFAMHYIVGFIPFVFIFVIVILYLIKKLNVQKRNITVLILLLLSVISVPISQVLCTVKPYRLYSEERESGLEIIGYNMNFINDYNMNVNIIIPSEIKNKKVNSIGESAFERCQYIDELIIPEGVEIIKSSAFKDSKYKCIVLPKSLNRIERDAFYKSTVSGIIDYVIIPENLNYIGSEVFNYTAKCIFVTESENTTKHWDSKWHTWVGEPKVYYDVKDVKIKDDHYIVTYNDDTTEIINID